MNAATSRRRVPLRLGLTLSALLAAGLLASGPGCIPIQNVGTPENRLFIKGEKGAACD